MMETKLVSINEKNIENNREKMLIKEAGAILKNGGLVAFPTETVYGLGGDALQKESSERIYAAKGRPSDNPLIVHICCWDDIKKITKENKKVIITGMEEDVFPWQNKVGADLEEERRLFYVGVTRAKDELYLTSSAKRFM